MPRKKRKVDKRSYDAARSVARSALLAAVDRGIEKVLSHGGRNAVIMKADGCPGMSLVVSVSWEPLNAAEVLKTTLPDRYS